MATYIYYGAAGTGKSTLLVSKCKQLKSYVVLCYTHSACQNIRNKGITNVSTIHAYYKINPITLRHKNFGIRHETIFIDEFSLIPYKLLDIILKHRDRQNIVFVGDILQLPTISMKRHLVDVCKYTNLMCPVGASVESILLSIKHLDQSILMYKNIWKTSKKLHLTKTYRFKNDILGKYMNCECMYLEKIQIVEYMTSNPDAVLLCSRYKWLNKVYDALEHRGEIFHNCDRGGIHNIYMNADEQYVMTKNHNKSLLNGTIVKYVQHVGACIVVEHNSKRYILEENTNCICPHRFYTIHRSQGLEFDRIAICLDDLFEISMLYTAISRGINSVVFYSNADVNVSRFVYENSLNFNVLRNVCENFGN